MTPYGVIATGFAMVLGAMLTAQLLGMAGRQPFRPLGDVVHTVLRHRAGRWVVLALWLWVGFHFLAR
ncbi:MAG TPA: DUF6186 family protein [Pseudonocardiaceae bacterium]|nr:DUF6186 family protein [Pseudonocardiaceae bacterium]